MKKIRSEFYTNFETYTFGYAEYAILENLSDITEIYSSGYLPYTGSPDILNHFYLCRSLRVDLSSWKLNSENKRVQKKHDEGLSRKIFDSFTQMDATLQQEVFEMYAQYFAHIHGANIMPKKRLEFVFASVFQNKNILYFDSEGKLAGGIIMIENIEKSLSHIWYIGYTPQFQKSGFGIWMFLDCMQLLQSEGYTYLYLGTAYGNKAKYKLNFEALEYWDGNAWNSDIKRLKALLGSDDIVKERDVLKEGRETFTM
jgi:arginine-tRNA-protein transferase